MYFLDSYAMLEYFAGNQKYVKLIESNKFCTSDFQLMELYYITLREQGEELAEQYYESFSLFKVLIPEKILKSAMKFRLKSQKEKLNISYVDSIGYIYAQENKLKFLTGEIVFKNIGGVEWIPHA